jgi:hypothetical protein
LAIGTTANLPNLIGTQSASKHQAARHVGAVKRQFPVPVGIRVRLLNGRESVWPSITNEFGPNRASSTGFGRMSETSLSLILPKGKKRSGLEGWFNAGIGRFHCLPC